MTWKGSIRCTTQCYFIGKYFAEEYLVYETKATGHIPFQYLSLLSMLIMCFFFFFGLPKSNWKKCNQKHWKDAEEIQMVTLKWMNGWRQQGLLFFLLKRLVNDDKLPLNDLSPLPNVIIPLIVFQWLFLTGQTKFSLSLIVYLAFSGSCWNKPKGIFQGCLILIIF